MRIFEFSNFRTHTAFSNRQENEGEAEGKERLRLGGGGVEGGEDEGGNKQGNNQANMMR